MAEFATNGKANAALTTGIIGTAGVGGVTDELIEWHRQAYRELLDKVMKFKA